MQRKDNTMSELSYKFYREQLDESGNPTGQKIPEEVKLEKWRWEAYYNDGTILKQYGDDGIFHQLKEIDQSKLHIFKMVSNDAAPFVMLFDSGSMKLIHFYRRSILNAHTLQETKITWYCFGYERGKEKVIFVITQDNEVVITDDMSKITIK